jgi:hypothetical protein
MRKYRIQQGIFVWHIEAHDQVEALLWVTRRTTKKHEIDPDRDLIITVKGK